MRFKVKHRFFPVKIQGNSIYIDGKEVQVVSLQDYPSWRKNLVAVFNMVVAIFICMTGVKYLMTRTLVGFGIFIVISVIFTYVFLYSGIFYFRGHFFRLITSETEGILIAEGEEIEQLETIKSLYGNKEVKEDEKTQQD